MKDNNQCERLVWYYENMNDEGRETLLKIARAFVATGTFSRMPELSEEALSYMEKLNRDLDKRMEEDF